MSVIVLVECDWCSNFEDVGTFDGTEQISMREALDAVSQRDWVLSFDSGFQFCCVDCYDRWLGKQESFYSDEVTS